VASAYGILAFDVRPIAFRGRPNGPWGLGRAATRDVKVHTRKRDAVRRRRRGMTAVVAAD
jgi:hypothetical protein